MKTWIRSAEVEQSGATVYCSLGQEHECHQPRYDLKPDRLLIDSKDGLDFDCDIARK